MKFRRLGKSNLRVSIVGMGTWQFGGEWGKNFKQDEVDRIFDAARETGINFIDTAECYGDHTSEAFIGKAITGERDKWILATKFGHKFHSHMNRTDERSADQVRRQVEDSLRALRTDYIDLLQYHSIRDSEFDNPELTELLQSLLKSGKVRHLGNSVSGKTENADHQVRASEQHQVQSIQVIYNRLDRRPEKNVLPLCQQMDLGVLARVPLASGFLSGKYKPGAKFQASDVRADKDQKEIDEKLREVEIIQRDEVPQGVPMAQWALAWCLQHPAVTAVIPGCKNVEQVRSNAAAASLDLVRDDHPQAWKAQSDS